MKAPDQRDEFSSDIFYLSKLASLMEEQVSVLRRIDERQTAADLSKQPMPEVPATSSSAWNALLRSSLTETIQPKVDRWRSGLDALLVFLGLFSAIVTSFFVQSLSALKQDQAVRMNELLTNLTEIIVVISGAPPASLHVAQPVAFHPDSTDVRLNAFWSLSLILSLSLAALAVACRGFLNMVGWSRFTKASEKLIDIQTRWVSSERFLGPTIELLPQLLVIPVLLFIAGLLDTLFSSVLQLHPAPRTILFTSGISLLFISAVALLLCYTLTHRSLNPTGSLFWWTWGYFKRCTDKDFHESDFPDALSEKAPAIYHCTVQATHDDDALNQASAALFHIIQSIGIWPRHGAASTGLLDQERATFLHLLSPEASPRSNRTAVQVISRIQESNRIKYSVTDMSTLVPALLQAGRRSLQAGSILELFNSPFIHAMAIVSNAGAVSDHYPPVPSFLSSEYIDIQHLPSNSDPSTEYDVRTKTISFVVEILFTKLAQSLADPLAYESEDEIVDAILSLPHRLNTSSKTSPSPTSITINPGKIVAALIYIPRPQNVAILTHIIRWLVRETSPLRVLLATHAHVTAITSHDVWPTILFFIASIAARVCLALDGFRDHIALVELCVGALLKIADFHQFHPQLPALVSAAATALRRPASETEKIAPQMMRDLLTVRKFVEDDTWRWSAKQRGAVLAELESLEEYKSPPGPREKPIVPNGNSDLGDNNSTATISMGSADCADFSKQTNLNEVETPDVGSPEVEQQPGGGISGEQRVCTRKFEVLPLP
ncbi:hypothetical protein MVEN_00806100 [Mycena venus]|uniref:DUF6535 domain-containing protein n=1 Tax=Mycena venus TaxID=2733690 RepID=A0A8H6YLD5_9AGAR|nr:hypothetical protein MVEN_00806100 [Mycena venus]